MEVIDPGDPRSWPGDVREEVDRLADLCRSNPENVGRPSFELEVRPAGWDESFDAERAFRDLLGNRLLTYYHGTRLLPHEDQMFLDEGLLVLSDDLRDRRLDRVIELYGDEVGRGALEGLRAVGPACRGSSQRSNRLGLLHGVTPLDASPVRRMGHGDLDDALGWGVVLLRRSR